MKWDSIDDDDDDDEHSKQNFKFQNLKWRSW